MMKRCRKCWAGRGTVRTVILGTCIAVSVWSGIGAEPVEVDLDKPVPLLRAPGRTEYEVPPQTRLEPPAKFLEMEQDETPSGDGISEDKPVDLLRDPGKLEMSCGDVLDRRRYLVEMSSRLTADLSGQQVTLDKMGRMLELAKAAEREAYERARKQAAEELVDGITFIGGECAKLAMNKRTLVKRLNKMRGELEKANYSDKAMKAWLVWSTRVEATIDKMGDLAEHGGIYLDIKSAGPREQAEWLKQMQDLSKASLGDLDLLRQTAVDNGVAKDVLFMLGDSLGPVGGILTRAGYITIAVGSDMGEAYLSGKEHSALETSSAEMVRQNWRIKQLIADMEEEAADLKTQNPACFKSGPANWIKSHPVISSAVGIGAVVVGVGLGGGGGGGGSGGGGGGSRSGTIDGTWSSSYGGGSFHFDIRNGVVGGQWNTPGGSVGVSGTVNSSGQLSAHAGDVQITGQVHGTGGSMSGSGEARLGGFHGSWSGS